MNHPRSGPLRFKGYQYTYFKYPAPRPQVELKRGERMDNLEASQRPQGEDVRQDQRLHTMKAQAFAGTRALRTNSCVALLETGSPASIIRKQVWNDMPGRGAALSDSDATTQPRRWGGFYRKPQTTSTSMQPNVLLGRKGTISCESSSEDISVRPVVGAHIVPHRVRWNDLPLGRDSWGRFLVRK